MSLKRSKPPSKLNDTYYDAGQVVARWALGLTSTSFSICANKELGSSGLTHYPFVLEYEEGSSRRDQRRIARDLIISYYAGWEADKMFDPLASVDGSVRADAHALSLMEMFGVGPRRRSDVARLDYVNARLDYLYRLRRQARQLLKRHWRVVQAVAAEMVKWRTLKCEALERLHLKLMPKA